jgi:hypothetical protein
LGVAVTGLALAVPAASRTLSQLPPAEHAGPITYLSGGADAKQADAMRRATASYPLELDFLWGRGAKETPIANVDWSLKNDKTGQTIDAHSSGPVVLAALPDGHYTLTATYDGKPLTREVSVRKGKHDRVVLEWPQ